LHFDDLGAEIHADSVPPGIGDDLPNLYSSLFSTMDWFETHDDSSGTGVCILEAPRHLLVFDRHGDTLDVLNKTFRIAPADASRACRALFRAFPEVRRIHLEVMTPASSAPAPRLVLYCTDHLIVDLPPTAEEYTESLGRSTRGNLRLWENRMRRDFPDAAVAILPAPEYADTLMEPFLRWKTERFHRRGETTYWERDPALVGRFTALLRRCGEAHVTSIGGVPAAISFAFPVGEEVCSQETSFDPAYERYRLGLLAQYWVACDAAARGFKRVNFLWGTPDYKMHLGATPRRATAISVFRDQRSRLLSIGEAGTVLLRRVRRDGHESYWRARRVAGRAARGLSGAVGVHAD
jgi:CelD/BcsL family acetyltransferase involved in cellulose biosynthesis